MIYARDWVGQVPGEWDEQQKIGNGEAKERDMCTELSHGTWLSSQHQVHGVSSSCRSDNLVEVSWSFDISASEKMKSGCE